MVCIGKAVIKPCSRHRASLGCAQKRAIGASGPVPGLESEPMRIRRYRMKWRGHNQRVRLLSVTIGESSRGYYVSWIDNFRPVQHLHEVAAGDQQGDITVPGVITSAPTTSGRRLYPVPSVQRETRAGTWSAVMFSGTVNTLSPRPSRCPENLMQAAGGCLGAGYCAVAWLRRWCAGALPNVRFNRLRSGRSPWL